MRQRYAIDDARLTSFHVKICAFTTGGVLCDGYLLGIIAPALALYGRQQALSATWTGLVGASALIGLFLGSVLFGWLTDALGRQVMYLAGLLAFVGGSLLQAFTTDVAWLFAVRLLLGVAIGASYAISPTLLAEFAPRRHRGWMLASISAVWTVGYVTAFLVGYVMASLGDGAWRWMLASGAVPALIVILLRFGIPESPRWLFRKGRTDEALKVMRDHIDPNATLADLELDANQGTDYRSLFRKGLRGRVAFGGFFWCCQVVPYFAIFTFLPTVLHELTIKGDLAQSLTVNGLLLVGALTGMHIINRVRRRAFAIVSFLVLAVTTALLGLWVNAPAAGVIALFAAFSFTISAAAGLCAVYPSEMFPTAVRASGVGLVTALSRIGAAAGTFLLPMAIDTVGVHGTTLMVAGLLTAGLLASIVWAPETKAIALGEPWEHVPGRASLDA